MVQPTNPDVYLRAVAGELIAVKRYPTLDGQKPGSPQELLAALEASNIEPGNAVMPPTTHPSLCHSCAGMRLWFRSIACRTAKSLNLRSTRRAFCVAGRLIFRHLTSKQVTSEFSIKLIETNRYTDHNTKRIFYHDKK